MTVATLSYFALIQLPHPFFNCTYKHKVYYYNINYLWYSAPLAYHWILNMHTLLSTDRIVLLAHVSILTNRCTCKLCDQQRRQYQLNNSVPSIKKAVKCMDHLSKAISSKVASVQSSSPVFKSSLQVQSSSPVHKSSPWSTKYIRPRLTTV